MSASLKSKVETWVIAALVAGGVTPTPVAIDTDARADQERIFVNATVGEKQLEGPEAYPVDVDIELRSTTRDAEAVDALFATVEESMQSPAALDTAGTYFQYLIFHNERMSSESTRGGDTRTRSRKYPFSVLEV